MAIHIPYKEGAVPPGVQRALDNNQRLNKLQRFDVFKTMYEEAILHQNG